MGGGGMWAGVAAGPRIAHVGAWDLGRIRGVGESPATQNGAGAGSEA